MTTSYSLRFKKSWPGPCRIEYKQIYIRFWGFKILPLVDFRSSSGHYEFIFFFLNLLVQQANQGWEISFVDQMSVSGKLFFTAIFKPKSYLSNERLLSLENGSRVAFTRIWSLKLANNLAYNVIMMIDERPKYHVCP